MISRTYVQDIARLARIELSPEEEKTFERELSAILGFVEELNQADVEGVEPLAGGITREEQRMRADEPAEKEFGGSPNQLLRAAPEQKENWVKVKPLFADR